MENFKVKSFGPIAEADISFGDLTILVGPQASGKSIFIQLLKLLVDKSHVKRTFQQYNYTWGKNVDEALDFYFGEGMRKIWRSNTEVNLDGKGYSRSFFTQKPGRSSSFSNAEETLFYIPAQRILGVSDGRPKNFMEFDFSTPYVLRHFSETLRLLLQKAMMQSESIFPMNNRLKEPLRRSFNDSIFHDGRIVLDVSRSGQKKMMMRIGDMSIPFTVWSAGQKEFMPLLMGFYWLCPPSKTSRKDEYKYVVIEEPEMGLHPQAIQSVLLQVIDLLSRGYKVIISTHSPVILEFAWAFNLLKKAKAGDDALYDLFGVKKTAPIKRLFENILTKKSVKTFSFSRVDEKVITRDITSLDPSSEDEDISEWGGLSQFSSKVTDVVSKYLDDEKD